MSDTFRELNMQTKYNGWNSYETWLVNVWMTNDQGSCEYWEEVAREVLEYNEGEAAQRNLAHILKEYFEENMPSVEGLYADLLSSALQEVDWDELAEHMLEWEGVKSD